MTPEKRLNQLEPVVAEVSAQLDRVTAQNRTLVIVVTQNTEAIITQSDNIQFLLHEVADLKTEVADLKTEVSRRFDEVNAKVDLILQILQSGNGRH
ncbi:MAG: hypothetical protein LH609_08865 [Rudanella sp.]|nr:hypothetical protein [Rudanella sp.]